MIVVEPSAHILHVDDRAAGVELLKRIEYYARVSHRTEDRVTEDSYDRFLRTVVMKHGDLSVIEHEKVTVEAEVDRGISHEWVRHRIGAYTQESTRFVNYNKAGGVRFIRPPFKTHDGETIWDESVRQSEDDYMGLLEAGEPPELARSVLKTSTATKLIVTYNLRIWRHFLLMRTSREAHPQMREVTEPLLAEFQERIPILFEDIVPGTKQSNAMQQLR